MILALEGPRGSFGIGCFVPNGAPKPKSSQCSVATLKAQAIAKLNADQMKLKATEQQLAQDGGTTTRSSSPSSPSTTTTPTTDVVAQAVCNIGQLRIAAGKSGAASGAAGQTILFTNVGQTVCSMTGYPGVSALNAVGDQVLQAQRALNGMLGGVYVGRTAPLVTLQPGHVASAEIEGVDRPLGSATSCPTYPAFLVTPPDETHSVTITAGIAGGDKPGFLGCAPMTVNPVVPGTTGSVS